MELRFLRLALLLLFLTIVVTEGVLGPAAKTDGEKSIAARARGSSRFSPNSATSIEAAPLEMSSSSSDATITKTSRRVPGARRTSLSRSGAQITTTVKTDVGLFSATPGNRSAIQQTSEQSKENHLKTNNQGLPRLASRKLVPKVQNAGPRKNVSKDSRDNSQDTSEKKFLPESVRENARTARAKELGEIVETPKVNDTMRTGSRRSSRLQNGRSNSKLGNSEPSVFTGAQDNLRSRTGRKIQNSPVKISNSGLLSNSRYTRNQRSDDSNPNYNVGNNRRSFVHDSLDFRKKLTESRLKQDITASGSESVRFNIPLNFEEPKRLSAGGSVTSSSTIEPSKRQGNQRYKSRGRQPLNERKLESDSTTSNPVLKGTSRRTGIIRGYESHTEAVARGRNRGQDIKKNNIPAENSSTTSFPDSRRRNFNPKPTAKSFDTSRGIDNNRLFETKPRAIDRSRNRSRSRYRVEVITTDAPPNSLSTIAPKGPSIVTIGNIGNITPTTPSEVVTTLPSSTTSRVSIITSTRISNNDNRRNVDVNESAQQIDQRRRASKEDFFNHGLGFRGRRPPIAGVDQVPVTNPATTTTVIPSTVVPVRPENSPRGNPGWTLRRRPGHLHDGPLSEPATITAESSFLGQQDVKVTTASTIPKTGRRGNKTNIKASGGGTRDVINENDNYPADFKARLAQVQKSGEQSRTQEGHRLYTSSHLISNIDLDFASTDYMYHAITSDALFENPTRLLIENPSFLDVQQANKTMSIEQFAARSKMKLENARKLIKPELLIDETSSRQVIVDPSSSFKEDTNQKPSDSEVDEDQKVFKITRKSNSMIEKSESNNKRSTKSDWKPFKLRKNFKETQSRTSRYKQLYTPRSKTSLLPNSTTSTVKSVIEENVIDSTTQSTRATVRYKENKFKFLEKARGSKIRGPKPSHENSIQEEIINSTTKSPLVEKFRKTFTPRKNDKSHVEDIKAVALKLRKTLESMEKSQTLKPSRRSDSLEGSTTLLTTMRTVKSFSFSTRLVKMDESETATSSTMKMLEDEATPISESSPTTFTLTSTASPMTTEIIMKYSAGNEMTTSNYEDVLASSNRPSANDIVNEIDNAGAFSTTELSFTSTESPELDWNTSSTDSPAPNLVDYKPRAAALSNDSGTPVFVVYPSATEKPLSIAITPKIQRYQATVKPDEIQLGQRLVTQEPVVSVKVSSGNETAEISIQDSNNGNSGNIVGSNIFNPVESAAILETGNVTLLEQLRSTVAPLLNTFGNKSPVFSGVYKNTNSANSLPRITPSGAPPRFSARYRGAELFVRRPTPPTTLNSLTEKHDTSLPIDVSSPGESKVLTIYQAVETARVNNEQTDVRQLWQLARGAIVENNTVNDIHGTNGPNSDSPPIIPITNTFNHISPVYINLASIHVPDTTNISDITTTHETIHSLNDIRPEATSKDESEEATVFTTSDSVSIINSLENIDLITESTMSTSTELVTEVSFAVNENSNRNKVITTTSSSSSPHSAFFNTIKFESSTPPFSTGASSIPESFTEIPINSTSSDYSEDTTIISTIGTPTVNEATEAVYSRTPKKLDDSNSGQAEVSNSLLDITLSASNNETTQPAIMEVRLNQGTVKTTQLESLAQVKETTQIRKVEQINSTTESTTEILQSVTMLNYTTTEKSFFQTTEKITSPLQIMTGTSTVTQIIPELHLNSSSDTNEIKSNTELPITTSNSMSVDKIEDLTTTLHPEFSNLENATVTVSNEMSKNMDVEIQIYDAENTTVPAGTDSPLIKVLLNNKENLLVLEKLVYLAINLTENNSSDNNINKNLTEALLKIDEKLLLNSTEINESSFDQNNVDSSPEELSQLVESFVDNESQSVTNESTVETNNETTVVTQTTNMPETNIADIAAYTTNADINTVTYTSIPNTQSSENAETTFSSLTTTLSSDNSTVNLNDTNVRAEYFARMSQIFSKFINAKTITDLPADSDIQELNLLTPNSTYTPLVVDDITKTILENDSNLSSNLIPTTISSEIQTVQDLTTISPFMLTPLQGSTPATAQRTAGTTIHPNYTSTTSYLPTTRPSSSAFSSTTTNNNEPFSNNPQTFTSTTTTIPTIPPIFLPSSSFAPSTSSPADYPINKQQPTTSVSFIGRSDSNKPAPTSNSGSSSSTTAPVRDYLIYGILPNKTIVRKKPEDNLIDARNVDSPYVIFGIFPDGKLVRKFPNGTVIPDPPSNPVEVVFSLSTTTITTNRPSLSDNQFINQGSRNKNFDYINNRSPVADVNTQNAFYEPNEVDIALSSSGPTGFNLPLISVGSGTNKMMATVASNVTLDNNGQGGRIIQHKSKDETSRSSVNNGQRNSVFVGQEKFVNYWTNRQPSSNPTALSVNLTSVATSINEGSSSALSEAINLDNLPNSQSANRVTAPPGFPWKDPLDHIFGIPSDSPALNASQTVNAIDSAKEQRKPIERQHIDNLVEMFSPIAGTINSLINNPTKPTITTTTLVPTTQTSITSTSATQVPTMSPPTTSSTKASSFIVNPNLFGTRFEDLAFLNALLEKPNPGEATPKTLSEVERLLANKILTLALGKGLPDGGPTRSPKAIQPSNVSPNSLLDDKVFGFTSSTPAFASSASQPIVINFQPPTTTKIPTILSTSSWKPVQPIEYSSTTPTYAIVTSTIPTTTSSTAPSTTTMFTTPRTTTTSTTVRTTRQPTTKVPVIITAKSVVSKRPRPTTQAPPTGPFAFAVNLLQTIFGRNPFTSPTTPRPVVRKPIATVRKVPPIAKIIPSSTPITSTTTTTITMSPTPTTTTAHSPQIVLAQSSHTPGSIQINDNTVDITSGQSIVTNMLGNTEKPVEVTLKSVKQSTSTFSPEEDAKFLAALLELARNTNDDAAKSSTSTPQTSLDANDETFLRAILTDQAKIQPLSTAGGNDLHDAALLAAFLKSQGIEPSTPPNSLRQQLQQASKTTSTTTRRPTITTTTTRRTIPRRPSKASYPSAYPPPLFSNFGALSGGGDASNTNGAEGTVRSQVVDAAIGMTRAFGQFLGAAITGAAQQFQSFIKNGTRWG